MKQGKTIHGYSSEEVLFVIHNYSRLTSVQIADVIGETNGKDIRMLVEKLRKRGFIKPVQFYGLAAWRKQAAEKKAAKEFEQRAWTIKRRAIKINSVIQLKPQRESEKYRHAI